MIGKLQSSLREINAANFCFTAQVRAALFMSIRLKPGYPHDGVLRRGLGYKRNALVKLRLRFFIQFPAGIRQAGSLSNGITMAAERRKR